MRVTLDDLRLYFSDRKGDVVSAVGVFGLAVLLTLLARLSTNSLLGLVAFVNFAFLWVPIGSLWQKRRLRERWREIGLDDELLRHCEALTRIDWELDEQVDSVLGVYTTIYELHHHHAWLRHSAEVEEHVSTVRAGLLAFLQRVQRVGELRRLYERTAQNLRQPERLASLQSRLDREHRLVEVFADAFEAALFDFSQALGAAMSTGDERAARSQLHDFAAAMRRLARTIDDEDGDVLLDDELDDALDDDVAFRRLLDERDPLDVDAGESLRLSGADEAADAEATVGDGGPRPNGG